MARITILTIGSRGDIQPFCALALGLLAKGHSVTLASNVNFADFAAQMDIPFSPIAGDFQQLLQTPAGVSLLQGNTNITLIEDDLRWQQWLDAWDACQDSDLMVLAPLALWGYHLAEALNIPAILTTQVPITATRAFPLLQFANTAKQGLRGGFNLFTYRLFELLSWQKSQKLTNQFRQDVLQLSPISRLGIRYRRSPPTVLSPLPTLNCYSAAVLPPPNDWPSHIHQGGYCFLETHVQFDPPPALRAFLQREPQPLYIGFGSMMARNPEMLIETMIKALRKTQQRAVLCSGWGGFTAANLPDSLFVIEEVPHDWLLPKVAAAIHHGGAGTTAATLKAGIPSIVIPFFADQPAWGKRLEQLGVASNPIPHAELTVENLADSIQTVIGNKSMQRQAQQLSIQICSEDGVAKAIDVIEHYLQ